MTDAAPRRPTWSVADAIRESGAEFFRTHGTGLTGTQRQALGDLARCRTAALGGHVTFGYKDYADDRRSKVMTLSGVEFLRRFVQHVLPKGFVKVRHYGLLANRDARLAVCRRLLAVEALRARIMDASAPVRGEPVVVAPSGVFEPVCPFCGSRRIECRELPREASRTAPVPCDTS